ncbi:MAG: thioredoxin fold domain-containing protein [Gammaproteobacteria bacterium]|nr:thioredoxin fold domain-containing protein [Gammaproteobacteria bacterium]
MAQDDPAAGSISPESPYYLPEWERPYYLPEWVILSSPDLDLRQAVKVARANLKQVMLYFYEDDCADCKRFIRNNFTQRTILEKTNASYQLIAINVAGSQQLTDLYGKRMTEEDFAARNGILFAPSLLFLDKEGDTVVKLNGYTAPYKFRLALGYGTGQGRSHGSRFRDYFKHIDPVKANKEMNRQSFFLKPPYRLSRHEQPSIRPLLVIFEQANCMVCDEFHQSVMQRQETLELLDAFDVVQLDMRSDMLVMTPGGKQTTASNWAYSLGLKFAPTLLLFDEHGEKVLQSDEELNTFRVQSMLAYGLNQTARRTMSLRQFMKQRFEGHRERGIRVEQMR